MSEQANANATDRTPSPWPPSWPQFWASHERRVFTPVFNSFLESLMLDERHPLELRIAAWLVRRSWGNHVDSPVNAEGIMLTQTDCARELKVFDRKGQPDRRKVNPIFRFFEECNCLKFEGQSMVLNDNPLNVSFAKDSPKDENGGDFPPPLGFTEYVERVWKEQQPARFKAYQKAGAIYKKLRIQALTDYQRYKDQMSETGPTNGHIKVTNGSDNLSATEPTRPGASLCTNSPKPFACASSSSGSYSAPPAAPPQPKPTTTETPSVEEKTVVATAMAEAGIPADDVLVKQTIVQCREIAPECTGEEIAAFAKAKAHLARKAESPAAYLSVAVVNCFRSENWRQHLNGRARAAAANAPERAPESEWDLEERIHALECWLADPALLNNPNTPTVRSDLENLRRQLAERRADFGTHPAGGER